MSMIFTSLSLTVNIRLLMVSFHKLVISWPLTPATRTYAKNMKHWRANRFQLMRLVISYSILLTTSLCRRALLD
nr:hypothetical protein Iba_chr13dCG8820 [Ipomoea batatas]